MLLPELRTAASLILIGGLSLIMTGCKQEQQGGPRVKTVPIKGGVLVDGKPAAGLKVECHLVTPDPNFPYIPGAITDAEGRFEIATYEGGDGAPPGDYKLTFVWGEMNLLSRTYQGDKLKKKYADPLKSETSLKVVDKPIDMGDIPLSTR